MDTRKNSGLFQPVKKKYRNVEEAIAACEVLKNAHASEEGLKDQEPPVASSVSNSYQPGDQGIRVKVSSTNQGDLESLLAQLGVRPNEGALLLERYGDVIETIRQHPTFKKITKAKADGGWDVYPQALTIAVKNHALEGDLSMGIAIVLAAVREVANYRAAREPRKLLFHVLAERYPKAIQLARRA